MKTEQSATNQKLLYSLIGRTVTPLLFLSFLLISTKSYSLVPDYAEVTQIQGQGISLNSQPARRGGRLSRYNDVLAVPAPYGNELIYANLDLVKMGEGKLWIRAKAWNNSKTEYRIPCTINQPQYTQSEITWSNGKRTACAEGVRFTSNSSGNSNLPNSQTTQVAQTKNLDDNQLFLTAQARRNRLLYYCSSVPNSNRGSGHIAAGLSTIEEACWESQETCQNNNRNSGCSIATMGEWNLNDRDLMMSVSCADGQSSFKRVSGSQISAPGTSGDVLIQQMLEELFGEMGGLIGQIIGIQLKACYLEVYRPDEILISPDNSRRTTIVTTGLENGTIQVNVIEGQVNLRSMNNPEGIKGSQGDSYIFNERRGSIFPGEFEPNNPPRRRPTTTPTPNIPPIQ